MARFQTGPPPSEPPRNPGGAPGRGTSTAKLPGVPADYRAPTSRQYSPTYYPHGFNYRTRTPGRDSSGFEPLPGGLPPRYKDGDQLRPVGGGASGIAETKRRLVLSGYLDIDDVGALGVWDDDAVNAYQRALIDANRMGMDVGSLMMQAALQGGGQANVGGGEDGEGGGGGGGWMMDENGNLVPRAPEQFVPEPFVANVPNMDDVRAVFRSASVDKLGRSLSQAEIDAMARVYQQTVVGLQRQTYNRMTQRDRQLFETGTTDIQEITSVEAPSPANYLSEELERTRPGEVDVGQLGESFAPAFFAALGGFG